MVHFAQKFDLHAHVMFAVGNLPQLTFLDDLHGFTTEGHAICKNDNIDIRDVGISPRKLVRGCRLGVGSTVL